MGNVFTPDPKTVFIRQGGYARGNGAWFFGAHFDETDYMDSRLSPYLTQEEYSETLERVNQTMQARRNQTCPFCAVLIPIWIVGALINTALTRSVTPAHIVCTAENGACPSGPVDATVGGCCKWWCCPPNVLAEMEYATHCHRIDSTNEATCDCATTGMCKDVRLEGETMDMPEQNSWAGALATGVNMLSGMACCGALILGIYCSLLLRNDMDAELDGWRSKGLQCSYYEGRGGRRGGSRPGGIIVHMPMAPMVPMQAMQRVPLHGFVR